MVSAIHWYWEDGMMDHGSMTDTMSGHGMVMGTDADEAIDGGAGDDTIIGGGGNDFLNGFGGDDRLDATDTSGMGNVWGHDGNDTLIGSVPGMGQIHMGGADGDDVLIMDLTNDSGRQGHHVYGGRGADRFEFINFHAANSHILGRIDDFDASEDTLWFDGEELRLTDLPDRIDVVSYNGQQWLRIGDTALYALEGARAGGNERHFTPSPFDLSDLPVVEFVDQKNYVPVDLYQDRLPDLVSIEGHGGMTVGSGLSEYIFDEQLNRYDNSGNLSASADSRIVAGKGGDVINAGKGDDTVEGNDGFDVIAGGVDSDYLHGGNGNDTIFGGSENDTIIGGQGADTLYGGTGHDEMHGNGGNDRIFGGHGNDQISGQGSHDTIHGQGGDDIVFGGRGNDRIFGGAGDDVLFGGGGQDTIRGGAGRDLMKGNGLDDTFVFAAGDMVDWDDLSGGTATKESKLDVIRDFQSGIDTILFDASTGVRGLGDLEAWRTDVGGDAHFVVRVTETNERFLVNTDDTLGHAQFMTNDNFDFG